MVYSGVFFTEAEEKALATDLRNPHWDLEPPQREEYESDFAYAKALKAYAGRILNENHKTGI